MKLSFATGQKLFVLSTMLLSAACGEDDKPITYSSGVTDRDKPASSLSDDDKREYCSALDNHVGVTVGFEELSRILCLPAALLAPSRASCQDLLDSCSRNSANPITVDVRQTREKVCYDSLSSCESDVRTLEGCVNVNVGAVRNVLETITCARFGDNSAREQAAEVMNTGAACASSSNACDGATDIILL